MYGLMKILRKRPFKSEIKFSWPPGSPLVCSFQLHPPRHHLSITNLISMLMIFLHFFKKQCHQPIVHPGHQSFALSIKFLLIFLSIHNFPFPLFFFPQSLCLEGPGVYDKYSFPQTGVLKITSSWYNQFLCPLHFQKTDPFGKTLFSVWQDCRRYIMSCGHSFLCQQLLMLNDQIYNLLGVAK